MTALDDARATTTALAAAEFMAKTQAGNAILAIPPAQPLVGTWLDQGMLAEINGHYGSGKTLLAIDLGLCIATGEPFHGQPIHRTGQVLYVMAEGAYTAADRVAGWLEIHDRDDVPEGFVVYPGRFDLTSPDGWAPLRGALELGLLAPTLMVLDTRSRLTSGDENDKVPTERLIAACDLMRELVPGMTILIVHHPGHGTGGRARGHSSFEQDLDVVWSLAGQLKRGPVTLTDQKQKARATNGAIRLGLAVTDGGFPVLKRLDCEPVRAAKDELALADLIVAAVAAAPGKLTARQISKEPPEPLAGVGSQRTRLEMVDELIGRGVLVVARTAGKGGHLVVASGRGGLPVELPDDWGDD